MPLVTPALSALAIFTFLGNWTAFFWPLIVTTERGALHAAGRALALRGRVQTEWEMIMTGRQRRDAPDARSCSCCCSATSSGAFIGGTEG